MGERLVNKITRLELKHDEKNVDIYQFKAYLYLSENETDQLSGEVHHYSNNDIEVVWDNQEKWLFENCYRIVLYLEENDLDIIISEPIYKKIIKDSFNKMFSSVKEKIYRGENKMKLSLLLLVLSSCYYTERNCFVVNAKNIKNTLVKAEKTNPITGEKNQNTYMENTPYLYDENGKKYQVNLEDYESIKLDDSYCQEKDRFSILGTLTGIIILLVIAYYLKKYIEGI